MIFQFFILPLPWFLRRRILCWKYGYEIDPTAYIGCSIVLARKLVMRAHSSIAHLTICKRIDKLEIHERSSIGSCNFITGFTTFCDASFKHFAHVVERHCELVIGCHSAITSRHFLDCNGGIYIGNFVTVAGIRSQFLTHSIDIYKCRQDAKPIRIGDFCFVGTSVLMLPGSVLPAYCILAGGAVVTKALSDSRTIYAGAPARPIKDLIGVDVGYFKREVGFVI